MSTRSISVFALAATFFVLGTVNPSSTRYTKIVESKQAVDFCCLAGLSCCIYPPGGRKAEGKDQLTAQASKPASVNELSRREQTGPTAKD